MARPLRSRHFTNRPEDQVRRLNQCGTDDAYHIEAGQSGVHVAAIQAALLAFQARANAVRALTPLLKLQPPMPRISSTEIDSRTYGDTTRAAVKAYKKAFDIRRSGQADPDDIVGIMTIDRMDEHMVAIEGQGGSARIVTRVKRRDLVVMFPGTGPSQHGTEDTGRVNSMRETLRQAIAMTPLYHDVFMDPPMVVAVYGAPRGSAIDPVRTVHSAIQSMVHTLITQGSALGRIMIFGSSIGGPNALTLAAMLSAAGRNIRYLRLGDAGFDDNHRYVKRTAADGREVPMFVPPASIVALESYSTYQTRGNEMRSKIGTLSELHGGVLGLMDDDLSNTGGIKTTWDDWVRNGQKSDDKNRVWQSMHDQAADIGERKFHDDVVRIIKTMY